jgi:hypothetical protein
MSPSYGIAPSFRAYPNGSYGDDMWFGQNGAALGFGQYPAQVYPYQYGPPSGYGNYSPQDSPRYYNFNTRNYGPAYPYLGGINGGPGYYQGW